MSDDEFKSSEEHLKKWLVAERKVLTTRLLGAKAPLLYQENSESVTPSSLLNISAKALLKDNDGTSNKLKQEKQQRGVLHLSLMLNTFEVPLAKN